MASPYDGAPASKPGCSSRHLEVHTEDESAAALDLHSTRGSAASLAELPDGEDPVEYCFRVFKDALPVVPPTRDRVLRMIDASGRDAREVIARIPPCYGEATVEKIAANAVMGGV